MTKTIIDEVTDKLFKKLSMTAKLIELQELKEQCLTNGGLLGTTKEIIDSRIAYYEREIKKIQVQ